jgi:hypothetical protein
MTIRVICINTVNCSLCTRDALLELSGLASARSADH